MALVGITALFLGVMVNQSMRVDFTTTDDKDYRWDRFDDKWVVVNYFAEWCAPCLREMPELSEFSRKYGSQIPIFAMSFDQLTTEQLIDLKKQYEIDFPVIKSISTLPWQQPPRALPSTYIIAPGGKVKKQLKGEQTAESLYQIIEQLKTL